MSQVNQPGQVTDLQAIGFRDPVAGARNCAHLRSYVSAGTYESLLRFLTDSPDPDTAAILLDRLLAALSNRSDSSPKQNRTNLHYASMVFGCSPWLGETLVQNLDVLKELGAEHELNRSLSVDEFRDKFARVRTLGDERDLSTAVAKFRKCEYVRILVRDLAGLANLAEVTQEISSLSDALVDEALRFASAELVARHGVPGWVDEKGRQHDSTSAIVSLGKLGGCELNYSSDVDLMFLYRAGAEPPNAKITNAEYFALLVQRVTELLSRQTQEGQPFRIDLRLRPYGHAGALAVPLPQAIHYYKEIAADWELQAMIKARHSAGDPVLSQEFIRAIAASVYRPDVNFAAVKTALQARERIDRRNRTAGGPRHRVSGIDVKLDRGGIRDIEFLVQCLQRMYGGREPWLRSRGTLYALQKLHDKEHISGTDFHSLSKAYEFLRTVEHRLQLRRGQQSHQLPTSEDELQILAKCMGIAELSGASPASFVAHIRHRMSEVSAIYERMVYREQSIYTSAANARTILEVDSGLSTGTEFSQALQRVQLDIPELAAAISSSNLSPHGSRNLARFCNSAMTGYERLGALLHFQSVIATSLHLFELSDYLTDLLVRHPGDLAVLQSERPVQKASPGEGPALIRQRFRRDLLLANASDLSTPQEISQILAANSQTADAALQHALELSSPSPGFAVMALGRLGSREFDVLSDADVLFVRDDSADPAESQKAAERMVEVLTAYTKDGTVLPLDTRLRPQGAQGELVTTPQMLSQYFEQGAKAWEAVSYLRLRFIAGNTALGASALEMVRAGIATLAAKPGFADELWEMRCRLEPSDPSPNLETGPGGIFDIDFLAGRLQALHQLWSHGGLAERVAVVHAAGRLSFDDAQELQANAIFLRSLEHYIRLVTGRAGKWLPAGEHARNTVDDLLSRRQLAREHVPLTTRLERVLRRNREICLKYPF